MSPSEREFQAKQAGQNYSVPKKVVLRETTIRSSGFPSLNMIGAGLRMNSCSRIALALDASKHETLPATLRCTVAIHGAYCE